MNALNVALKDRPRIFQVIVLCLFSASVFTVIICAIQVLQKEAKPPVTAQKQEKPHTTQPAYASFSR